MATIRGTTGDDILTGTSGNDVFKLWQGGEDTASGGDGNDTFNMGAALDAGDRLDGGAGNDLVFLKGDYSAGLVFDADTIQNVETLRMAGNFTYNLTLDDGNVAAGQWLKVNAAPVGGHLVFDGSAESDGHYRIYASAGDDQITGGQMSDRINIANGGSDTVNGGGGNDVINVGAALAPGDSINGGAGNDTLVVNGAGYSGFSLVQISSIEKIQAVDGNNYSFSIGNSHMPTGTLTIDASALTSGHSFGMDGTGVTSGSFDFIGGAGADTMALGGPAVLGASTINGGAGNDTVYLKGDYSGGFTFGATTVSGVEVMHLQESGFDYHLTMNDANVASGATMVMDGGSLSHALVFDATAETDGAYQVTGGSANDTATFADGYTASDTFNGGAGTDTLVLESVNGLVSAHFNSNTIHNVEQITLDPLNATANEWDLTTNNGNVASGQTLTIDATALGASDTLNFNGAAETDGSFTINTGSGTYNLTGGSGNDTINFGILTGSDTINGGSGDDTLIITGDNGSDSLTLGPNTLTNIDHLIVGTDADVELNLDDNTIAAGATMSFDGSKVVTHGFYIDGEFETDGHLDITGGGDYGFVTGGALSDTFTMNSHTSWYEIWGGGGADTINLAAGQEIVDYLPVSDSTSTTHDIVTGFDASEDAFHFGSSGSIVSGYFGTLSGTVNAATLDTDLGNISDPGLAANDAWVVNVTGGDLSGHQFLIVDANGDAHYSGGSDYLIDISGYTGTLDAGNFV